MQPTTPSSEIIHTVLTFGDCLDSLPPSLTRSLSDLKELDAVLSGSLQGITTKLVRLHAMMMVPPPGSEDASKPSFSAYDRLKLLREVTEDARVFRLGGEDKIRVATSTCESIGSHSQNLATLASLFTSFLPNHLIPLLPAATTPYGIPTSYVPASTIARRQAIEYPTAFHPASGSTARIQGAHGLVADHRELVRSRTGEHGGPMPRVPLNGPGGPNQPSHGGAVNAAKRRLGGGGMMGIDEAYVPSGAGGGASSRQKEIVKEKDPGHKHPNQYTKRRLAAAAAAAASGGGSALVTGGSAQGAVQGGYLGGVQSHPLGISAVDSVKEKRRAGGVEQSLGSPPSTSRASSVSAYGEDGGARAAKRKVDEMASASKRRKKAEDSPDVTPRTAPATLAPPLANAGIKPPRRSASKTYAPEGSLSPALPPLPSPNLSKRELDAGGVIPGADALEEVADDEADNTPYCYCQRPSFGEMIGCDGETCELEWFHLSCVGLQVTPKGSWLCDECKHKKNQKKGRR